jgi:hypothetical protein
MGQPPEDGEDGFEQDQGRVDRCLIHVTPRDSHGEVETDLAGRAGGDAVAM